MTEREEIIFEIGFATIRMRDAHLMIEQLKTENRLTPEVACVHEYNDAVTARIRLWERWDKLNGVSDG